VSLALAIAVTAVMVRSTASLHAARADLERTRAAYALDGAAAAAEFAILQSRPANRFAWEASTELGVFSVLAEAETAKLPPSGAAQLDGEMMTQMGVKDPSALAARLASLSGADLDAAIAAADPSRGWRACGRSLVSPWGRQAASSLSRSAAPDLAGESPHLGEVWRIRVTTKGFADDRIVRLTGDAAHPAAVVERRLYRTNEKGDTCDRFADAKPKA
jgi:hypothetical protein